MSTTEDEQDNDGDYMPSDDDISYSDHERINNDNNNDIKSNDDDMETKDEEIIDEQELQRIEREKRRVYYRYIFTRILYVIYIELNECFGLIFEYLYRKQLKKNWKIYIKN